MYIPICIYMYVYVYTYIYSKKEKKQPKSWKSQMSKHTLGPNIRKQVKTYQNLFSLGL